MLKRILAVLTTALLAIGLTVGVASSASAHDVIPSTTCTTVKVKLQAYGSGSTNYLTVTIDGSVVENHTSFADGFEKQYPVSTTSTHTYKIEVDAQGTSYDKLGANALTGTWIPCASTGLTCDVATLYKGSPLGDNDDVQVKLTHNGGAVQTLTAKVERRQSSDPASESGFVVRLKLESGTSALPITNAQKASGILAFSYSPGFTGTWIVQWVTYNNTEFNASGNTANYLHCQKDTPVVVATAPSATAPTCSVDGTLVVPAAPAHVTWSGGVNGAGPGTYTLVATPDAGYTLGGAQSIWVVQVLPQGTGLSCGPPPCIASNQVSYTYDPATNSGTVTVPNPAGSSGVLCDGFWVTAVSWKFVGSTVWPQSLDQNNPMPEKNSSFFVDEPGTYSYAADVVCGQGDIYASYDAQPVPTAVLNGPNTPYAEHFLHDMGFSGPTPTYTQDAPGCNKATPVAPTTTQITVCGTDGSLSFGPTAGVVYALTSGNGTSGAWEVTATPAANYYFDGPQVVTFTGNLGARTDCVAATEPALTTAVCDTASGLVTSAFITIPSTQHLTYRVDGTIQPAGAKVELAAGSHTVTVQADAGWTNTGASTFPITVANVPDCDDPVEYVAPIVTHQICDATTGDISDATIAFADVDHLTYFLDGDEITGAQTVTVSLGAHVITVKTDAGYYLKGTTLKTEKDYPVTIIAPASCDDPVKYVAPTVTDEVCDAAQPGGSQDGVVTFVLPAHLTYVFDGTAVTAADLTIEKPVGTYDLVVTAETGYFIEGGGSTATYQVKVDDPGKVCDQLTTIPIDPFATPEECVAGSLDGDKTDGSITIVHSDHVTWEISNDLDGVKKAVDTSAAGNHVFPYAAGNYHVWATPDAGYVLKTTDTFAVTVHEPTLDCDLPTHAFLDTAASWTHQVCTTGGLVDPTITVEPFVGVTYFIDGIKVAQDTTTVAPGQHQITAVADDPTNTVSTTSWSPMLLTASSAICGDLTTLAFTGETPGGWLILAIVFLQAGLVLVAIRFVRSRRTQPRHLVG